MATRASGSFDGATAAGGSQSESEVSMSDRLVGEAGSPLPLAVGFWAHGRREPRSPSPTLEARED